MDFANCSLYLLSSMSLYFLYLHPIVADQKSRLKKIKNFPNIVLILTDDQDEVLQSLDSMPKLKRLISDRGARFPNTFVTTPVCCPSRAAIITGRFVHNNGARNNSIEGNCASAKWQTTQEHKSFPNLLHKAGYSTFYAGKYLNKYGFGNPGRAAHVPPGWDWWNGLVAAANHYYYNYSMSINGTKVRFGSSPSDYLTTLIQKQAFQFLRHRPSHKPFFMMLCPTACHGPFTSEPQYHGNFTKMTAPRTPSFNRYAGDKHWMLRMEPKTGFSRQVINMIDQIFRERWRSLQSVDQMIENLVGKLEREGTLGSTIIIFSSDNGYQLGQFMLPKDKRQPYEFDIRVPLAMAGPGIAKGIVRTEPAQLIDLAPTILEFAGVTAPSPDWLDGRSLVQLAGSNPTLVKKNIRWRNQVLIEYWGERSGRRADKPLRHCYSSGQCYVMDAVNNTYSCLRRQGVKSGVLKSEMYCEFRDNEGFKEYYNLLDDPWELKNAIADLPPCEVNDFHNQLKALKKCHGNGCRVADVSRR